MTTAFMTDDPRNTTTSYYHRTWNTDWESPVSTATVNQDEIRHIEELRKYCWITDEDERHLFDPDEYPGACQALLTAYCYPDPTQTATPTAPPSQRPTTSRSTAFTRGTPTSAPTARGCRPEPTCVGLDQRVQGRSANLW